MKNIKNPITNFYANFAARAVFVCPISMIFAEKTAFFQTALYFCLVKHWNSK
jgi:hypothetical protein